MPANQKCHVLQAQDQLEKSILKIKEIADAYDSIKNNVIDFKNIVA